MSQQAAPTMQGSTCRAAPATTAVSATPATRSRGAAARVAGDGATPGRALVAKCLLLTMLMLSSAATAAQSRVSLEYAVKATYLYKLAPFVNWPPDTFTSPNAPFEICVLGRDPFNGFLVQAVAGRRVGTHPFEVRRLAAPTQAAGCQIVFIGDMRVGAVRDVLRTFDGKPVLTVTDSGDADSAGSIVQFVLERGHVRFDIDNAAAARNHLAISSKLLNLALTVKGDG